MSSQLFRAIVAKDVQSISKMLSVLRTQSHWSLVSFIDEMVPCMLMETNLQFHNFHLVKMGLFLRKLAVERYFSAATEYELLRLVSSELVQRQWFRLQVEPLRDGEAEKYASQQQLLNALSEQNAHNAFYYVQGLLNTEPEATIQLLLTLGALHIPDNLGHSLSCFFPVAEHLFYTLHPHTSTALLSYVMFLCRFKTSPDVLSAIQAKQHHPKEMAQLLKVAASGSSIVDLHHMITLYVFTEWRHAAFNPEHNVPFELLLEWIGPKPIDRARESRMEQMSYVTLVPHTYAEFVQGFSLDDLDQTIAMIITLLENEPGKAIDWTFRTYAGYYSLGRWDPHYFTSLYAAFHFFLQDDIEDIVAARMAVEQAMRYFAAGVAEIVKRDV